MSNSCGCCSTGTPIVNTNGYGNSFFIILILFILLAIIFGAFAWA